jgi:hypothetical protein
MVANPEDLGEGLAFFESSSLLTLILPHPSPEDTDLVLVIRVMNGLLSLMGNCTEPSRKMWATPIVIFHDWWRDHIPAWLKMDEDAEYTMKKV